MDGYHSDYKVVTQSQTGAAMRVPEALLNFGKKVGLEARAVMEAESIQAYKLTANLEAGILARLSEADLGTLQSDIGDALTLTIGLPDVPPLLSIYKGVANSSIPQSLGQIAKRPSDFELRLTLDIDKPALLKRSKLTAEHCHCLYYLFLENLTVLLQSSLLTLDTALFANSTVPTIVVVSDAEIYHSGPLLIIIGEKNTPETYAPPTVLDPGVARRIVRYHAVAADNLSWIGFRFEHLTPLHFTCRRLTGGDGVLDPILCTNLLHLCLLYTANRSSYDDSTFRASFSSPDQTITLTLASLGLPDETRDVLGRFALWPQATDDADRLTIFQNTAARELSGTAPENCYSALVQQLPHLLEQARWHHRVFVNGQIDKHFEQVRTVSSYVSDTAKNMSEAVDGVAKNLTDALLATVGVIVLTLLASLIKNETTGALFRVGMQVYAGYLLAFQGFYRMGSIWHSYILLSKETRAELITFERVLGRPRVQAISAPLVTRNRQFLIWFWLTAFIYVAVTIAILALATGLPGYLAQLGIVPATPTATPMPGVTPSPTTTLMPGFTPTP